MKTKPFDITTPPFAEVCGFTVGRCAENDLMLKDTRIGTVHNIRATSDIGEIEEFQVWCVRINGDEYEFERVDCPHHGEQRAH